MAALITDRVKQLVRMRGPLIPSQISKDIGTNILMASAILSELSSKGDVKISSVKVGGTPLYYVPGQEAKLQNYLAGLHQKEREAFEHLKSEGVLLDTGLDPATRVAMRQLKDFAKPLEVSANGGVYLFWKWYLLPNEEAEAAIKKTLGVAEEKAQTDDQASVAARIEPVAGTDVQPKTQTSLQQLQTAQATLQQTTAQTPLSTPAATQTNPFRKKAPAAVAADFARLITNFFSENSIEIESSTAASKSEARYVVLLPSPVGGLRYYCIAKNKKTCTDSDISSAIVQGQLKKLPVLLLTKGELTKKAHQLLSGEIGAIVIKKI